MTPPVRDGILSGPWLLALFLAAVAFLYLALLDGPLLLGFAPLVAVRLYQWRWHPFSGAARVWNAGEIDRYVARQLAQRDRLLGLSPREFEHATAQLFRVRFGWDAVTTSFVADGGWDVELRAPEGRMLVECKQYAPGTSVGRPVLQKLHSAIITERAAGGALVTTSSFSEPARQFAKETGTKLIDGEALSRLMREAYSDGQKADVTHTMCSRCGGLVEFTAGLNDKRRLCPGGHNVNNHLVASFLRADALARRAQFRAEQRSLQRRART